MATGRWMIGILAGLLACLVAGACTEDDVDVPPELIGTWMTTELKYRDRYVQLTFHELIFGAGDDERAAYPIRAITRVERGRRTLYTMTYENRHRQQSHFSFFYDPTNGGAMTLRNQQKFHWTKEVR